MPKVAGFCCATVPC